MLTVSIINGLPFFSLFSKEELCQFIQNYLGASFKYLPNRRNIA